jgi:gas vesicle protein
MSLKSGEFLGGILLGALIGAALGLLFAPEAGDELRQQIKDRAGDYKDKAVEKGSQLLEKGKEVAREKKEQIAASMRHGEEEEG